MAKTVKCKACGNLVSKQAKACPQCGEPVTRSGAAVLLLVLIVLVIIGGAMNPAPPVDPAVAEAQAAEKAAKKARREAEMAESRREMQALGLCAAVLKQGLRDPKSLEWDRSQSRVVKVGDGYKVSRRYSAANAFGGRAQGVIVCEVDGAGGLVSREVVEF